MAPEQWLSMFAGVREPETVASKPLSPTLSLSVSLSVSLYWQAESPGIRWRHAASSLLKEYFVTALGSSGFRAVLVFVVFGTRRF